MSKQIDNGGTAFPVPGMTRLPNGTTAWPEYGMSLRDYYAAKAMGCIYDHISRSQVNAVSASYKEIVKEAYELADAMLAERNS